MPSSSWYVYIVKCSDESYYTGITNNPAQRIEKHNSGKGARYTRLKRPVKLVYLETQPDKVSAMKRELKIKHMTRERKGRLIKQQSKDFPDKVP